MNLFRSRIITFLKFLCLGTLGAAVLCGQDLIDQSINSGGGWVSNSENSSFTIYGEVYQSAQVDIQSPTHTVDLNSTVSLEMIWVEPGTFTMGSFGESQEHEVTLTKGYYLGKYEVAQSQYQAVVNSNPSNFSGENKPVEYVSWGQARNFVQLLNQKEADNLPPGWGYVLPTEAEWEFACRAGTTTSFNWGNEIDETKANYSESGIGQTIEVGQYSPNNWGFYDMHGNAREWTADIYMDYSSSPQIDPTGGTSGDGRVTRGGFYGAGGGDSSSKHRNSRNLHHRHGSLGFRLALKNTNEAPAYLNNATPLTIVENQPIGTIVGEFNATDPDGNSSLITYNLVVGDNNNSLFSLDTNGTLRTAMVFDYESNAASYTIRVQARDELNATVEGNFTVSLEDVFEDKNVPIPPTKWRFVIANSSWSWEAYVMEMELINSLGVVLSSEGNGNPQTNIHQDGLVGIYDASLAFDKNSTTHIRTEPGDGKIGKWISYNLTNGSWIEGLRVTSGSHWANAVPSYFVQYSWDGIEWINYWTATMGAYTVTDFKDFQNTSPTNLSSLIELSVSENQPIGTIVGEFNATDPDGNATLTYSLVDGNGSEGNGLFNIESNGQLTSSTVFDYETNASSYSIRVQARDDHNASTEGVFTISLEDLFEDSEGGASVVFWSSQVGGSTSTAGVHRINFDGTNKITLFDFDAYIAVDKNYLFYSSNTLGNIYRSRHDGTGSEILISGYSGLLKVEANHLYWLKNGEGLYRANLDGSGVELYLSELAGGSEFWGTTNYWFVNNGPSKAVKRYDRDGGNPTNIHPEGFPVANGAISADEDWVYWSKWNGDVYRARHDGSSAENINRASFVDSLFLYESYLFIGNRGTGYNPVKYTLRNGTNGEEIYNGLDSKYQNSIAVIYNQFPTDLNTTSPLTVSENQAIGTIVGEFNATDPDGDANTYHLVSGEGDENNSLFTLDQNCMLKTAVILDYESGSTLTIRVQARDELNATVEGNFTVTLTDIFEDLDGDGIEDHLDDDMDGDGFTNDYENEIGSDPMDAQSTPLNFGLVVWYPFDGNASDMSGNGNDGTVYGATLTTDRHGEANRAYSFDGDNWIEAPHFEQLNFSGDQSFTVSVWTKIDPVDASGTILEKWTTSNDPYPFAIRYGLGSGNLSYAAHRSGGGSATAISVYSTNTYREDAYHHLIIVSTKTDIKIYQDSILKDSYSFSSNEFTNSHKLMFGKREGRTDRSLYGVIDDVRIYNYAFGGKEIRYLYKKESPHHFTDLNSSTDLEMIWVEPGTFTMGQYGVAEPEHEVTLTKGFYLGKYEVTQAQYEAVMTGNDEGLSPTPSYFNGYPDRPVEQVSWEDVQVFLERLNEQAAESLPTGWAYVLPTEAQWEYACRAGTTTAYSWGGTITEENANYGQNIGQTTRVGQYEPNRWGIFDMLGNVSEWCSVSYSFVDPIYKSERGGSWGSPYENLRVSALLAPNAKTDRLN
ncbi:SUMF1/EgtB/PvdO family nonheme iron enzyme, partial [Opitutales bacterium]|nr:SUMF1/EgtB/PvdO family nonheme iron enzyme [Opitutales bacterium]